MTHLPLALFDVGTPELLLVMVAILVLFGGQRLPELAKGLGRSLREFKKASAGVEQEIKRAIETAPAPAQRKAALPPPVQSAPAVDIASHPNTVPTPPFDTPPPPLEGPATPKN